MKYGRVVGFLILRSTHPHHFPRQVSPPGKISVYMENGGKIGRREKRGKISRKHLNKIIVIEVATEKVSSR